MDNLDFSQQIEYLEENIEYNLTCIPLMGISDAISNGLYYVSLKMDNVASAANKYVGRPLNYVAGTTINGLKTVGEVVKYPIEKVSNAWGGVKNVGSSFLDTQRSLTKIMNGINSQEGRNFFSKLLNIDFDNIKRMMTLAGLSMSQIMQIAQLAANFATQLESYLSSLAETTQVMFLHSINLMRLTSIFHLRKKMHQIKQIAYSLKPSKINQNIQHTANIGFKIYDRIFNPKEYKPLEYLQ